MTNHPADPSVSVPQPNPSDELDLDEIEARLSRLTSDDWSGYADDEGTTGRCELFAGPFVNGYRTGSVFAVRSDCECGCYPPSPDEMRFIECARQDVPALVAEVRRLRGEVERLCACDCASREDGNPHHQGFCRSLPTSLKRERAKRFAECYSTLAADTRNVNDLARQLADAHDETATARAEVEDWRDKWAIVDEDRCEAQRERDAARAEAVQWRENAENASSYRAAAESDRDEARAEAERLREAWRGESEHGHSTEACCSCCYQVSAERAEASRVREALQAIRDLHCECTTGNCACGGGPGWCHGCDEGWPCSTVRALDAALDGAE